MESKLPKKYNDSVFSKIKEFFLKIFGKKNNNEETVVEEENVKENRLNSIEEIRKESKINREKESLLNQIEKDVSLIDNWPIEKLLKLEEIYDEKIERLNISIYFSSSQALVSLITVTFIVPGYCISSSILPLISRAILKLVKSSTSSGFTITLSSLPACTA